MIPMEGGFTNPGLEDFHFEPLWGTTWVTKPLIQLVVAAIVVVVVWCLASRKLRTVPSKSQFLFEQAYDFIRSSVGRDVLGPGFRPYLGVLIGLFTFVLFNNWFGEFFLFMFPTFSKIGFVWGMVGFVYLLYIFAGFRTHGIGYLRKSLIPEGVPWYLWVIIIPIEFLSNFVTRPLTLAVRLFANMFAGHLTVVVFVVGGTYLLTYANNLFYNVGGGLSLLFGVVMMGFELFIGFIQAYIFTILVAQYISSSISESH